MPPSSRGPSTCRLSLSCLAYRLAVGVVLLANPTPSSRPTVACAWRRPSHVQPPLSGEHASRWSSSVALLTPRVLIVDSLLYYLIRPQQQRVGDRQPQGLRGLHVDDQLELRRLIDRQVAGIGALQNLGDVLRCLPEGISKARCIGDEAAGFDVGLELKHRREALPCCKLDDDRPICRRE